MNSVRMPLLAGALLAGLTLGTGGCVTATGGFVDVLSPEAYFEGAVVADYGYNDFGGAVHVRPPFDSGREPDRNGHEGPGPRGGAPAGGGERGGPPSIPHNPPPERGGGGGGGGGSRGGGGGGGGGGGDHKK